MRTIGYRNQSIDQDDIDAVVDVMLGDCLTQGPRVEDFEEALCKKLGCKYACVVSNGTAALHLTALALGWSKGDIVITSPITFLATANCILYAGATPDFVDIEPLTNTIDCNRLEQKIKEYRRRGKKVKAVIGIDFAGHPSAWLALRDLADRFDFQLVNDSCHALGARYFGDAQYATKYADVATLSFHPVKHITTGEGGAILTNEKSVYQKVNLLRTHGVTRKVSQIGKDKGPWHYDMVDLGYNYRLSEMQCALGLNQLKKLDKFVEKRRELAIKYNEKLQSDERLVIPNEGTNAFHSYHLYPIKIRFDSMKNTRNELFKYISHSGIRLQVHYIPIYRQPYYSSRYLFDPNDYPVAEKYYEQAVSLPIYPSLSTSDQDVVVNKLNEAMV